MDPEIVRNELKRLRRQVPFRPFALTMDDGESCLVSNPENIAFDPRPKAAQDFRVISEPTRQCSTFEKITRIVKVYNMDFGTTLSTVRGMNMHDRLKLVQAIWDEIAADQAALELTEAQKCELDRRIADDDANPNEGIPWEVIREEARARWRK